MNKNLNETMMKYLEKTELYLKITVNLQELIIEGYNLGQITKEEIVDFYTKVYKVCSTDEIKEAGERFNELFGEEITESVMETMYSEEG
jgi:hypothetical protein